MSEAEQARARRFVAAGFAILWAVSLALPAIDPGNGPRFGGYEVLLQGWRAAARGVYSWYANPLFFVALIALLLNRLVLAAAVAGGASALALTSFAAARLARDGGLESVNLSFGPGFYLWLTAQIGLFGYCCLLLGKKNSRQRAKIGIDR